MSDQFSAQGTAQFKAGAFLKAAALYTKALNALPADASERRAVLLRYAPWSDLLAIPCVARLGTVYIQPGNLNTKLFAQRVQLCALQLQLCSCTHCSAAIWLRECGAGSNRCACLLKLHKLDKALADAQQCVSLRGDWDKAHYRVGSALEALGRHAEVRRPISHCIRRVPLLATPQQRTKQLPYCLHCCCCRPYHSRQGTSSQWLCPLLLLSLSQRLGQQTQLRV